MPALKLNPYDVLLEGLYGKGYARRSALAASAPKTPPVPSVPSGAARLDRAWSLTTGLVPRTDAVPVEEQLGRANLGFNRVALRFAGE